MYLWPYFWVWTCNWNLLQLSKILLICPNLTLFWPFLQASEPHIIPPPRKPSSSLLIGQFENCRQISCQVSFVDGGNGALLQTRSYWNKIFLFEIVGQGDDFDFYNSNAHVRWRKKNRISHIFCWIHENFVDICFDI